MKLASAPEVVLVDLIWNCELAVAGIGKGEEMVADTRRELQSYISTAAGVPMPADGFTFDEFENVEFVSFKKHV
jgi:hypothetical protein